MGGKGGGVSYSQRPLEKEEKDLIKAQTDIYGQFRPAIDALTKSGTAQISGVINPDYRPMYRDAQVAMNQNTQGINNLASGQLPSNYIGNKMNYYGNLYNSTFGNTLNTAARKGVINSSVMNKSIDSIQNNMMNQMSQDYNKDLATQSSLLDQQQKNIYQPFTLATTANQASFAPVSNYIGLASGQASQGTGLMSALSNIHSDRTIAQVPSSGKGLF